MRRIQLALLLLLAFAVPVGAQQDNETEQSPLRPATIGFGIAFHDFSTARQIRNSSLVTAINNKRIAKFGEMAPGLSIMYAKGLRPKLDVAASLAFASGDVYLQNKPDRPMSTGFLAAEASIQAKMLPETFFLIPYVSAGVGGTITKGYYGAIIPVGAGLRFRLSEEFQIGLQSQYRVAVTETAGYHFMHGLTIMGKL